MRLEERIVRWKRGCAEEKDNGKTYEDWKGFIERLYNGSALSRKRYFYLLSALPEQSDTEVMY
jgi:hypothetical protein